MCFMLKLKLSLSLVKKPSENVRHFALNVENLVKQGWYNEYLATVYLKCIEVFTYPRSSNLAKKACQTYFSLS